MINKTLDQFAQLIEIVKTLRGPTGCPWDKEQTQESLIPYIIEESYELVEAIESKNKDLIIEELGDHLYQTIIQAQVAQDENQFSIFDVLAELNAKLLRRHPHVFGNPQVLSTDEVLKEWEIIKTQEKKNKPKKTESDYFSLPPQLPALQASQKIGDKSKRALFDWENADQVWEKVTEEIGELKQAQSLNLRGDQKDSIEHEVGDLLFSVVQLARHLGVDAESALRKTNERFKKRFYFMHQTSGLDFEPFLKLPASQKEPFYKTAKKLTR